MTVESKPIQRHTIGISPDGEDLGTYPDADGRYVLYDDHEEVVRQLKELLDAAQKTTREAISKYWDASRS